MGLTREEIVFIAKITAIEVLAGLHRYPKEYQEPAKVEDGLHDSMVEELTASDWYRRRAKNARANGDELTGGLYTRIAEEEEHHFRELNNQLKIIGVPEWSLKR